MIALLDGDIISYRCACSCEKIPTLQELASMGLNIDDRDGLIKIEDVGVAYRRVDDLVTKILHDTSSDEYKIFISGGDNFRLEVNPLYKANRKNLRRPAHLQACNEYLVTNWGATVTDGIEADDALGIHQTKYNKEGTPSTLCTIDKDLMQIPGLYYNFVKEEFTTISELEGLKFLWRQMLIGDTVDNIQGVKGIGEKGAIKYINHLSSEEDMYDVVSSLYSDEKRLDMNYKCLKILTEEQWESNNNYYHG